MVVFVSDWVVSGPCLWYRVAGSLCLEDSAHLGRGRTLEAVL